MNKLDNWIIRRTPPSEFWFAVFENFSIIKRFCIIYCVKFYPTLES